MSIRSVDEGRKRQQSERTARRNREAEARPDSMHRAIVFLLRETMQNNPDCAEEARHYLAILDKELAVPDKVAEIEAPPVPAENGNAGESGDAGENAEQKAAPDTATAVRRSRRFQSRT
jgi:hypothetical protein